MPGGTVGHAGLGLTGVSVLMSGLPAVVLEVQFRTSAHRAGVYWLAVALIRSPCTAAGDLVSERMDLGYWRSAVLFAAPIAAVAIAHFAPGLDTVWSFWIPCILCILTRPLGASLGDHLSQPTGDGGLGLGTVVTSALFLTVVLGLVVHLSATRRDVSEPVTLQAG